MSMTRIALTIFLSVLLVVGCPVESLNRVCAAEDAKKEAEVYVPKDLDDCFVQLKKILKPEDVEKMKRGAQGDMVRYHHGLGRWIRNNWDLWKGGRLSKWFNDKGIYHADDMSGIILDSFWRHLNSKPIELDKQIRGYQNYWKKVREDDERKKARRVRETVEKIRGMMMALTLDTTPAPKVRIPDRAADQTGTGLQARFMARFGDGVLLTVRTGAADDFTTPGYYLNLKEKQIHPIKIPEIENQQYAVVAGSTAYFAGLTKGTPVLVAVAGKTRSSIAPARKKSVPQLGIDGESLLAVYANSIYVLHGTAWSEIYTGAITLPDSGPPPRKFGEQVYFRDEGQNEYGYQRLWWLQLGKEPRLFALDKDVGIGGKYGPRWKNAYSYCVLPDGDLWATIGSGEWSLIKRSADGRYRVAIINDSLQFNGELLPSARDGSALLLSAVSMENSGDLLLAGGRGISLLQGKRLRQVVAFENVNMNLAINPRKWHGRPGDILRLDGDRYLLSGMFGGIYLIERTASGEYRATSLDETVGKVITY
jgi:hypothetical protein